MPVEVPLTHYFRELKTVQVVSGVDTLRLLLDTGGGHTLITPQAAQRLGCDPLGRSVGHRMSGERVDFEWCPERSLILEGVPLPFSTLAVFDLGAVLPPELPVLDGLLSLKSFTEHVVTFELAENRLILESAESTEKRKAEHSPLKSRSATGEDGSSLTIFLAAEAASGLAWLLLDSGNLVGTILSPAGARRMQSDHIETPPGKSVSIDLRLIGLPARATQAHIRDIIYDGVLGVSFFLENVVTFDLRSKQPWVGVSRRP